MIDIKKFIPAGPDPHHKASNSAIHEDIWELQLIMCEMKYPRSQLRAFLDISQNIVSFFSCCLQRLFSFPPQKHGLQHNWDITFQFGLYRGVDVRTYVRTVARSRDNQNFSHRWVTTFSYQWCSARGAPLKIDVLVSITGFTGG